MPRQQARAAALAVVLAAITPVTVLVPATVQAKGVRTLEVEGPRVTLADVLPSRPELASVDLGVAPPAGGSRLITKKHIRRALDELAETGEAPSVPDRVIPATVRITRKAVRLDIERQKELVGQALRAEGLAKGVTIARIRPRGSARVATGWERAEVKLPKPPRREGKWSTSVTVRLVRGDVLVASFGATVDFEISAAAARPDVARGSSVTLVVRHGRVEVRVRGFADSDADIGQMLNVRLRPSDKVVQARLETTDRAIAVENR